jgi:hypothetical protein
VRPTPRLFGLTLAALILLQLVTLVRLAPPAAVDASAPADAFSAERAFATLERVLEGPTPHPVGTPANARVRERLLAELRALGLEPQGQLAWAWSQRARGAFVNNIVARLPGGSGKAILLLCHHDSVPAGPGASDDGMGVAAVLEVARALLAGPPLARPVILAFTDGEEMGLLGARAFERAHPAARELGAVVNLEARGTSGPSFMFETTPGNAWMVPVLARALPRPLCSSLFPTVYERLPNDTDLTVFLESADPPPSFNFACIGDVDRYHTPLDDLAHLSKETLQQHGDNALSLVRALAAEPLEERRRETARAVYFDIFGLVVVRWPEPWSVPLALVALALVGASTALRREGAAWGALAFLLALALPLVAAQALAWTLGRVAGSVMPWAAAPRAGHAAFWCLALAIVFALHPLARRARPWGAWSGVWLGWSLLGVLVAWTLPGASFLFVAPALVAGLAGLTRHAPTALVAPCLAAACLWLPLARGLEAALGLTLKLPVAAAAALVAGTLLPLYPATDRRGRALPWAALCALAVCVVIVLSGPPHSAERPQRVNIIHAEDADARAARLVVEARSGDAPAELAGAGPTTFEGLAPPTLEVIERDPARVRARVRSPRGAWAVQLRLRPAATAITVAGERLEDTLPRVDLLGVPPEGIEVLLELAGPTEYDLEDASFGLPASAARLREARPDRAVPSQQGDLTTVVRAGRF